MWTAVLLALLAPEPDPSTPEGEPSQSGVPASTRWSRSLDALWAPLHEAEVVASHDPEPLRLGGARQRTHTLLCTLASALGLDACVVESATDDVRLDDPAI